MLVIFQCQNACDHSPNSGQFKQKTEWPKIGPHLSTKTHHRKRIRFSSIYDPSNNTSVPSIWCPAVLPFCRFGRNRAQVCEPVIPLREKRPLRILQRYGFPEGKNSWSESKCSERTLLSSKPAVKVFLLWCIWVLAFWPLLQRTGFRNKGLFFWKNIEQPIVYRNRSLLLCSCLLTQWRKYLSSNVLLWCELSKQKHFLPAQP